MDKSKKKSLYRNIGKTMSSRCNCNELTLTDKWDNIDPLNVHPFSLK